MGQQQLLLVILVVIIVGISTIIAVNILGVGADNANEDAVRQDLLTAASHVQEIWERPAMLDGANKDFTTLSETILLEKLRIMGTQADGIITNENGSYEITIQEDSELKITGTPTSDNELTVEIYVCYDSQSNTWLMNTDSPTAERPDCN